MHLEKQIIFILFSFIRLVVDAIPFNNYGAKPQQNQVYKLQPQLHRPAEIYRKPLLDTDSSEEYIIPPRPRPTQTQAPQLSPSIYISTPRSRPALPPAPRPTYQKPKLPALDPAPRPTYQKPKLHALAPAPSPTYQKPKIPALPPASRPTYQKPKPPKEPDQAKKPGMPYEYGYSVDDSDSGNKYSHSVKNDGKKTQGQYEVLLPDGRTQVVKYYDDGWGFVAEVTFI